MKRLLLAWAASGVLACGAHAAPSAPSYAAISLVGDKLDIVTYQPKVGTRLDNNSHTPLTLSEDELDAAALRAIGHSLHDAAPGAPVALLAASTPDSFADQDHIFNSNHVTLPAEIDAAVHREGVTMLVLVTKHRGEAHLKQRNSFVGSGMLDGLGYYLDTNKRTRNYDTNVRSTGYLAPYVYADVSLIDVTTSTIVRQATIMSGYVIGTSNNGQAVHPWDALSNEEKVEQLKSLLTKELQETVPALINGERPKAE